MLITGILITNKAHLLVMSRELQLFLQSYVEANIEGANPITLDPNFIAADLQSNLEREFKTQFSVTTMDSETGDPLDEFTRTAALEVSTPLDFPSLKVH
jgi:hypothetical protein